MLRLRAIVFGVATLLLGGCEVMHMNPGRVHALVIAARVGEFRQVKGHWPARAEDLDAAKLPGEFPVADFGDGPAAPLTPHRVEMNPDGENLRVEIYDPAGRRTCKFRVLAPTPGNYTVLMPRVIVKTSVFTCPGEGKRTS